MLRVSCIVLIAASCWASVARADFTAPAPPDASKPEWYGWQILLADSAAVIVGLNGARTGSGGQQLAAVGIYFAAVPIIHAAHDRNTLALGSFALRFLAVPTVGLIGESIGAQMCAPPPNADVRTSCAATGGLVGIALGVAGVSIVDAVLSWTAPAPLLGLSLSPYLTTSNEGSGNVVGLVGRF